MYGEVPESFYDNNNFPVDKDHDGKVWCMTSNADHIARSKVLYHPAVIEKKKEGILLCVQERQQHEVRLITDNNLTIEVNKDTVVKIKEMVNAVADVSNLREIDILEHATMEMFEKVNAPLLTAFYKYRVQQDLKLKVEIPAKGNVQKINDGEVNRQSKGLFLIQLCHNVRSLNTIYDTPVIHVIEVPIMVIISPHVV